MSERVYLHYTQAELDRNFDQRGWVKNAQEVIVRYSQRSAATRAELPHRADLPYGTGADEVLDIFPATAAQGAPVQIFVHGGAWRNFTKSDYSFVARSFAAAGIHTVVLNFTKLPDLRLPDIVGQVRRGIEWVSRNAESFGGDREDIHLSAHSSGAHLAAAALMGLPAAPPLPADTIRSATFLSGPFDLEPVMLSARRGYMTLSKQEEHALSPQEHAERLPCRALLAYAEQDTDEFQRQTRAFAAALEKAGRLAGLVRLPGLNHFESIESLADPGSMLSRMILDFMAGEARRPDTV